MPLAYSYVRMSTETQLRGDSLRRQTELSAAYAEKHGLTLVTEFVLQDLGVSAFKGANAVTGALGRFLRAVEDGTIPEGSYLLVESLDRLSRENVSDAMSQFLSITRGGVNIVTLSDGVTYAAGVTDFAQLIYSLVVMSRANEESQTKSKRVGAAWSNKRRAAGTTKMTRLCPGWLALADDRKSYVIVPGRDAVVRSLFEKCAAGHGSHSLTRFLNASRAPVFGRSKNGWHESYITKILQSRAVLGEFQPHHIVDGKRVSTGDVIADYFPRIVDEDLFLRAQAARRDRNTGAAGRKGKTVSNLFSHIAKCEYCGSSMHIVNKGRGPKGGQYLRCSASGRGSGCGATAWRYSAFETSFLLFAQEVDLGAVLNATSRQSAHSNLVQRQVAAKEKVRDLSARRDKTFELNLLSDIPFLAAKLQEYELLIKAADTDLAAIEYEIAAALSVPAIDQIEVQAQLDSLRSFTGDDAYEHRLRLATKLRAMVTNLNVAPEGKRPQMATTKAMLIANEPDDQYRDTLLAAIDKGYTDARAYNPTFQVEFADGTIRRVVIDKNDATKMLVESVVEGNGDLAVRHDDGRYWARSNPMTETELNEICDSLGNGN